MVEKKDRRVYLVIAIIFIVLFAYKNIDQFKDNATVLMEAGYCIVEKEDISYTTIILNGFSRPYEFCEMDKVCDEFDSVSVLIDQEFDNTLDKLQTKWEESDYVCFQDNAKHTQKGPESIANQSLKSKILCCNQKPEDYIEKDCKPNTCGGRFTGAIDEFGCKLYAVELCHFATTCTTDNESTICNPQPKQYGSCDVEVKDIEGLTYFTKFTNCGLRDTEVCGTIKKYCVDERCSKKENVEYNYNSGDFIEGCGGAN